MPRLVLCVVLFFLVTWLGGPQLGAAAEQPGKLRVMTTIFPYYDWARMIGGEQVEATLLLPPGVEAHSFDPTPKDVVRIQQSDIFIYTGEYMEPWAEDLVAGAIAKGLTVIEAGAFVALYEEEEAEHGEHGHNSGTAQAHHEEHRDDGRPPHHHPGEEDHHHGSVDPHIWLEFSNAAKIVEGMARAFATRDQKSGELYTARAKAYGDRLKELDSRYAATLATCRQRTIIYGGHFAFGYLARRYQLDHVSPYKGFSPNAEPSPKDIAALSKRMKKEGHSHIFFEEGIEPKVAKVISGETGAGMLLLHGAHNLGKKELDSKVSYLSLMNDNLKRLRLGLQCR